MAASTAGIRILRGRVRALHPLAPHAAITFAGLSPRPSFVRWASGAQAAARREPEDAALHTEQQDLGREDAQGSDSWARQQPVRPGETPVQRAARRILDRQPPWVWALPQAEQEVVLQEFDLAWEAADRMIDALRSGANDPGSPPPRFDTSHIETILSGLLSSILSHGAQSYARIPEGLRMSLELLDALQGVRHPRTGAVYTQLIDACLACERPNLAAEVYVGLVEEWIMEGRLAEGGTVEEHREGGGPAALDDPAARSSILPSPLEMRGNAQMQLERRHADSALTRASSAARINGWFQGVRTWKFPGEQLSPGEALDLWHPKKLAIHEKMLGFPLPIPTSPPSLVPEPQADLLHAIVGSYDVKDIERDPLHYARYARALAILANTVLSRTLPITALPSLIRAFDRLPAEPAVYKLTPALAEDVEQEDPRPAMTAHAHVRRALFSLVLSPPSRLSLEMLSGARYKLPPLAIESVHILLHHTVRSFRNADLLAPLLGSLRRVTTSTINAILRAASLARMNTFAEDLIDRMLGRPGRADKAQEKQQALIEYSNGEALQASDPAESRTHVTAAELEVLREPTIEDDQYPYDLNAIPEPAEDTSERHVKHSPAPGEQQSSQDDPTPIGSPAPNMRTIQAMLRHYTVTSQFDKGMELLLRVIPELEREPAELPPEDQPSTELDILEARYARRAMKRERMALPGYIWTTALNLLVKSGEWGMADRTFQFAERAADYSRRRASIFEDHPGVPRPTPWSMPVHAYTIMLEKHHHSWRNASNVPDSVRIRQTAKLKIFEIYRDVVSGDRTIPDARFFNAYILCLVSFWRKPPAYRGHRRRSLRDRVAELTHLIADMERWRVPVPPGLPAQRELLRGELVRLNREKDREAPVDPVPITNKRYLVKVHQERDSLPADMRQLA